MNFTLDRTLFENSLRKITAISSSKSELTKFLRIIVQDNKVTLSATDQDIISSVDIKVTDKDSSCIVEAKAVYNLVSKLPKTVEEITATIVKGGIFAITTGSNSYNFKIFDTKFPEFDVHSYMWTFSIGGESLSNLIKKSGWAYAIKDEDREYLQGVLFEVDDKLYVSTTDARKFSCSSIALNMDAKFKFVVLSKLSKIINLELAKYKPKKKTDIANYPKVTFKIGKKFVDIIVGDTHYVSKILSTTYPDIRNKKFKVNYTMKEVNRKSLLDSINRLEPFTDSVKNMLSFVCGVKEKTNVQLKSYNISNKLNSKESLDIHWGNEELEVGFRASSLGKVLSHVGKTVTIQFESADRFFKVLDPESIVDTFYIIPNSKF